MAINSNLTSIAVFHEEVVQGTIDTPADWAANGAVNFDHFEYDTTSITQTLIRDEVQEQLRYRAQGHRPWILGLRNVELEIGVHWTGAENQIVALGSQIQRTMLSKLIKIAWGGEHRGFTREITAAADEHTITLDDVTGLEVGAHVAVQDLTSPIPDHEGKVFIRQITDITGLVVTLDEDLPFLPVATDLARAAITMYVDSFWVEDSTPGAGRTCSLYLRRDRAPDEEEVWILRGCKPEINFGEITRDNHPRLNVMFKAGSYVHENLGTGDTYELPTIPTTSDGIASRVIGRDTVMSIAAYGDTTAILECTASTTFNPGVPAVMMEGVDEPYDGLEGMCGWSTGRSEATFEATLYDYRKIWAQQLQQGQYYRVRYAQPAEPGNAWAITMPRAVISSSPVRVNAGPVDGVQLAFEATENLDSIGTTEIATSTVCLVMA